jgi:hypothetical protein
VEFEVKVPEMGKLKGKGTMILTTNRIILLNSKGNGDFKAFDLPLALMFKESFEQPIFGANYIKGTCMPLQPGALPGNPEWKVWFMNGGCGRFLKTWRMALFKIREASRNRT